MKVILLAGGFGTRLAEYTDVIPKPMVPVGGKPILWHIMKTYSHHGINDFIICCGYKGYVIKEYFANYFLHMSDVTFDIQHNKMEVHQRHAESWRVTLLDTGENTMTGGRLKRVAPYLQGEEVFCLTYGDGVSNINISKLVEFHKKHGKLVTISAVRPPARFGAIKLNGDQVTAFKEKSNLDQGWINGGFFVLTNKIFKYIHGDKTRWEAKPLQQIANKKQLAAFKHNGFWQPMDTLRDKNYLEELWESGESPWKTWE